MSRTNTHRNTNIKELKIQFAINKQLYETLEYYLKDKDITLEQEINEKINDIVDSLIKKNVPAQVYKYLKGMGIISYQNKEKKELNSSENKDNNLSLNDENKEIKEDTIGSFDKQY